MMIKRTSLVLAVCFTVAAVSVTLSDSPSASKDSEHPSPAQARRQAQILHSAMHWTLQHVHHEYYEEDVRMPLPAAVMKDVFAQIEKEQKIKLRWLAVEGQAMNVDHQAKTAFEKDAVKALAAGKGEYEEVDNGFYRRAGAIKLTNHCLKCHVPDRKDTHERTAGLIISIPIRKP